MSRFRDLRLAAKASVKRVLTPLLFDTAAKPIVVASTGRSASTLLCDSIAAGLVRQRFPRVTSPFLKRVLTDAAMEFANRLEDVPKFKFPVIKTHDFPATGQLPDATFLFVFGDPLESAQSVERMARERGGRWLARHLDHLGAEGSLEDLYATDLLNFEKQVNAWLSVPEDQVYLLPYERLWDWERDLSSVVGFPVDLPARADRASKKQPEALNSDLFKHLRLVYRRAADVATERRKASKL